jgi:cytochrome c peroxidase
VLAFLNALAPPTSPFLRPDGTLSPAAQAGKALFEGVAQCAGCHAAPLFIPEPSDPPTIDEGIGTGLAPINVPSLWGVWATAPYLHDGSAQTLMDALIQNPNDVHGTITSSLTQLQLERLVAYLKTL